MSYRGLATLLSSDGEVVDKVHVRIDLKDSGAFRHWSGTIDATADFGGDWGTATLVRLPDGSEGAIVVTHVWMSANPEGARRSGEFVRSGPPPNIEG